MVSTFRLRSRWFCGEMRRTPEAVPLADSSCASGWKGTGGVGLFFTSFFICCTFSVAGLERMLLLTINMRIRYAPVDRQYEPAQIGRPARNARPDGIEDAGHARPAARIRHRPAHPANIAGCAPPEPGHALP